MGSLTCDHCGQSLTGQRRRWCSELCKRHHHAARTATGGDSRNRITEAKIAEVKRRYPSCACDWDIGMVEQAWPRLSTLLPRRLEQLDRP